MGEVIPLFRTELSPKQRKDIEERIANIAVEIALLESERERLRGRL